MYVWKIMWMHHNHLLHLDSYLLQIIDTAPTSMACKPKTLHFWCYIPPREAWTWQLPTRGVWCLSWCPWSCQPVRRLYFREWPGSCTCSLPLHVSVVITPPATNIARWSRYTKASYKEIASRWFHPSKRSCPCYQPVKQQWKRGCCCSLMVPRLFICSLIFFFFFNVHNIKSTTRETVVLWYDINLCHVQIICSKCHILIDHITCCWCHLGIRKLTFIVEIREEMNIFLSDL